MILFKRLFYHSFSVILFSSCIGCHSPNNEKEEISTCAKNFAFHFFNLDFDNAFLYCTPESKPWIQYRATNITQKDIDVFTTSAYSASVEIEDIKMKRETDSTAIVICKLHHVLLPDSLEKTGKIKPEMTYTIPFVNRNGKWLIKMEGPLQSEK